MAAGFVQLPPDSTGKRLASDTWLQGADTVHGQNVVLYAPDGTQLATIPVSHARGPVGTATWTSSNVTNDAVSVATSGLGTVLFTLNGTGTISSGIVAFDGSDDAGITWYGITAVRTLGSNSASQQVYSAISMVSGKVVLRADATGWTHVRIRISNALSGTGSLAVRATAVSDKPFLEPLTSFGLASDTDSAGRYASASNAQAQVFNGTSWDRARGDIANGLDVDVTRIAEPSRVNLTLGTAATGLTAGTSGTHALAALAMAYRGTTLLGGGTGTSFALTTGKKLRVESMTVGIQAKAATATGLIANLHYNAAGAVTTSSQVVAQLAAGAPAAVVNSTGMAFHNFALGLDLDAAAGVAQVGVSIIPTWTTTAAVVSISVVGYEY